MLVLSRKEVPTENEIVIGEGKDQVVITVVAIDGCRVRLGIEAGKHIGILRGELKRKVDGNDNGND
jgi:carbon storage regulator CsrA